MAYGGIDVGTSGCKAIFYDASGNILSSASRSYSQTGRDGYRELDPELVVSHVKEVIREAAEKCAEPINCLAVASMGESIVCLDKEGRSLFPSMLTGDKRGIEECHQIEKEISCAEVHKITGLPLSELYALPKWVWLSQQTDVFQKAKHIFFYEDYIGWMLTAEKKVSYSSAARSLAFDIRTYKWSEKLLAFAKLTPEQFSLPCPSGTVIGTVLPNVAEELGLSSKTLVVTGGHDQSCCALGCGMLDGSVGEDGQGTCEVMEFVLPSLMSNDYMIRNGIPCAPHVIPGKYLAQIELPNCGILMNWTKNSLLFGVRDQCTARDLSFFEYMDNAVSQNEPGSIYVIPDFGSSGNPNVSNDSRGTIWGLTVHTTPEEIFQGIKEGMAYQIYMAFLTLQELGVHPERIRVTGGGAVSDYTMQLRADVFDIPMERMDNSQCGTLACAMLSLKACCPQLSYEDLSRQMIHQIETFYPRETMHSKYMHHYERYKRIYNDFLKFSNHPNNF